MKQIGLALGGGSVLGAAHVGVLKALEEKKYAKVILPEPALALLLLHFMHSLKNRWILGRLPQCPSGWIFLNCRFHATACSNEKLGELINEYVGEMNIKSIRLLETKFDKGQNRSESKIPGKTY